jgi:predicted GIY-YIG superfamily endonuclease
VVFKQKTIKKTTDFILCGCIMQDGIEEEIDKKVEEEIILTNSEPNVQTKDYIVYLLHNTVNRFVYIGSTNNRIRRLRQHNGELVGGARYTHANKGPGEWRFYGYVENLEKRVALSIEKRIQIRARKMKARDPLQRRLDAIREILGDYNGAYSFTIV